MKTTKLFADRPLRVPAIALLSLCLAACASTTINFTPSAPPPRVCQTNGSPDAAPDVTLVLWAPTWRANQKDIPLREAAAAQGIAQFFAAGNCFVTTHIQRVTTSTLSQPDEVNRLLQASRPEVRQAVTIAVRELGPTLRLFASPALLDGGTEVVLTVTSRARSEPTLQTEFTVRWQNGGPGVVKGVSTLPDDMASALAAALQPR